MEAAFERKLIKVSPCLGKIFKNGDSGSTAVREFQFEDPL